MKALIVDDEPAIRQALAAIMEQAGCESVDIASNGEDALRSALQAKYDLVTLDIRMPDVSGVDILPTIRSILPHSVIVILSAYIEGISEVHREHADLILQKPFKMEKISRLVQLAREIAEKQEHIQALGEPVGEPLPIEFVGIARETDRLDEIVEFYHDGIGLAEVGSQEQTDGSLAVRFAIPGQEHRFDFEVTGHRGERPQADRIVLHVARAGMIEEVLFRLEEMGYPVRVRESAGREGARAIVEDPDGRLVEFVTAGL